MQCAGDGARIAWSATVRSGSTGLPGPASVRIVDCLHGRAAALLPPFHVLRCGRTHLRDRLDASNGAADGPYAGGGRHRARCFHGRTLRRGPARRSRGASPGPWPCAARVRRARVRDRPLRPRAAACTEHPGAAVRVGVRGRAGSRVRARTAGVEPSTRVHPGVRDGSHVPAGGSVARDGCVGRRT